MTWADLQEIARSAIQSELGNMPRTMAERVAKRIVEDARCQLGREGATIGLNDSDAVIGVDETVIKVVDEMLPPSRDAIIDGVINNTPFITRRVKDGKESYAFGKTNYNPQEPKVE